MVNGKDVMENIKKTAKQKIKEFVYEDLMSNADIEDIIRIDFLRSSNWTLGLANVVWVAKIKGNRLERQVYVGEPLVPEYSRYEHKDTIEGHRRYTDSLINGELKFENSFSVKKLYERLIDLNIESWDKYNRGHYIDAENYDIAFYIKDEDGSVRMHRYMFMENSADQKTRLLFRELFEVSENGDYEKTSPDIETIANFERYEPGDYKELIEGNK